MSNSVKNPSAKDKSSVTNGNLNLSSIGRSSNIKSNMVDSAVLSGGKESVGSPKNGVQANMGNSVMSAASRGSGMSSGKFCLAADNIFAMNDKCQRLENDKERLA